MNDAKSFQGLNSQLNAKLPENQSEISLPQVLTYTLPFVLKFIPKEVKI